MNRSEICSRIKRELFELKWVGNIARQGARLRIERSWFEPWPGTLCCVLGQDTLLPQCLFPPRCINGYRRVTGCDGLAPHPGRGGRNTLSRFMLRKPG